MIKKFLLYILSYFSFVIVNYFTLTFFSAWAACACTENEIQSIVNTYGPFIFGIFFITIFIILTYKENFKVLESEKRYFAILFTLMIILSVLLLVCKIILIKNAHSLEYIFPSLRPEPMKGFALPINDN